MAGQIPYLPSSRCSKSTPIAIPFSTSTKRSEGFTIHRQAARSPSIDYSHRNAPLIFIAGPIPPPRSPRSPRRSELPTAFELRLDTPSPGAQEAVHLHQKGSRELSLWNSFFKKRCGPLIADRNHLHTTRRATPTSNHLSYSGRSFESLRTPLGSS